jgi:CO/xanthine dehydrogenase Mo-binding subunit
MPCPIAWTCCWRMHFARPPLCESESRRPEKDEHVNSLGIKGIGEIGIVGVNTAVANAVFNATGKRIRDLPIRAEKLQ